MGHNYSLEEFQEMVENGTITEGSGYCYVRFTDEQLMFWAYPMKLYDWLKIDRGKPIKHIEWYNK